MNNEENFLTIPNTISGSTATLHQKCLPKGFNLLDKTKDELSAETHRYFLKDPACFSLTEEQECVELDSQLDYSNLPLGAYLVQWDKLQDVSDLLKMSHGDSKVLVNSNTERRSCIQSGATMASISPANKGSSEIFLPAYKMLAKKVQSGSRITDDGLSDE